MLALNLQICVLLGIHIEAAKLLRTHGGVCPFQEKGDRIQWYKGLKGNTEMGRLNWDDGWEGRVKERTEEG